MSETLHDRCMRICGKHGLECFNESPKMLTCLSDMLINKAYGLSAVLDMLKAEEIPDSAKELLDESIDITTELINWVKYLQLTRDLRGATVSAFETAEHDNQRAENRFPFPDILKKHILLRVGCIEELEDVELVNFSRHGMQFMCNGNSAPDKIMKAELQAVHIDKTLMMDVEVKYTKDNLVGASIANHSSQVDLDFFDSIMGFLSETLVKLEGSNNNPSAS